MTTRRPLTRSQRSILSLPSRQVRHLTKGEKEARGLSAGADWIVPKGKRVTKRSGAITFTRWKDFRAGVSHTTAAKHRAAAREAGVEPLPQYAYKSAATKERAALAGPKIAAKARERAERNSVLFRAFEREMTSQEDRVRALEGEWINEGGQYAPPGKGKPVKGQYRVTPAMPDMAIRWTKTKLRNQSTSWRETGAGWIPDGDWHETVDLQRAAGASAELMDALYKSNEEQA